MRYQVTEETMSWFVGQVKDSNLNPLAQQIAEDLAEFYDTAAKLKRFLDN